MKKLPVKVRKFLWSLLIVAVVWGAERYGLLELEMGGNVQVDQQDRVEHMGKTEMISGDLWVTPFGAWEEFAKSAPKTQDILRLQTYEFTGKRVKAMLHTLLQNGVDVKIILEDKKYKQYTDAFAEVQTEFSGYTNFEMRSDKQMGTTYVHSKITLLDDEFWIQTANMTHSSWFNNREHFFVSSHSGVYSSLKTIFEKDRAGDPIKINDIHPNLVVCNINCRSVIEELLSSAQKSIVIQTQYISDPVILDLLKQKASDNNFELKIILADTDDNQEVVDYFGQHRAKVLTTTYNHTKMILVDGETLLLGSMNLSSNSLDKNREIGILLYDEAVIGKFLYYFEQDWK